MQLLFEAKKCKKDHVYCCNGIRIRKVVLEMDIVNIDYLMNIFKALSTELPEQMLYRENGDSIELRTPDSIGNCTSSELQNGGWSLIGSRMIEAA